MFRQKFEPMTYWTQRQKPLPIDLNCSILACGCAFFHTDESKDTISRATSQIWSHFVYVTGTCCFPRFQFHAILSAETGSVLSWMMPSELWLFHVNGTETVAWSDSSSGLCSGVMCRISLSWVLMRAQYSVTGHDHFEIPIYSPLYRSTQHVWATDVIKETTNE